MGTNINDVYYCNFQRNQFLNEEIESRHRPTEDLEQTFFEGPVQTRYVKFPMLDCRKSSSVPIKQLPKYNTERVFNPGYRGAYSGYNVEMESQLMNRFDVLQKCPQRRYVPGSNSDLFHNSYLIPTGKRPYRPSLVEKQEKFKKFNPNKCGMETNLGGNMFHNHTRQQTKNLKLK
tara:strand:+ start:280 stop:804 length:525 start_codon:yes stop_codon:yes gene_type:complete